MKYIKTIKLKNFQSHEETVINTVMGLNVITGPSDSGKSSIIRAIKWVLFNEPTGTSFPTIGELDCQASLVLNNGVEITRQRKNDKNYYFIKHEDGKVIELTGFGTDLPAEVVEATGVNKVILNNSNKGQILTISDQLEGPFLLSESKFSKAISIGKLVGVDVLDFAISELNKDILTIGAKIKTSDDEMNSLTEDLKKYDYLTDLKLKIDKLDLIKKSIKEQELKVEALQKINKKLLETRIQVDANKKILNETQYVDQIQNIVSKIEGSTLGLNHYVRVNTSLMNCRNMMNKSKEIIMKYGEISKGELTRNDLEKIIIKYNALILLKSKFYEVKSNMDYFNNILIKYDYTDRLKTVIDELHLKSDAYNKYIYEATKIEKVKEKIKDCNKIIDLYKSIDIGHSISRNLETDIIKLNNICVKNDDIKTLKKRIVKGEEYISRCDDSIKQMLENYIAILKEGGVCPTCLTPINFDLMDHIVKSII